jgi:NAD(P)-dependent dehydrogenase (short-subunit alcohol dehydrogenase family)
LLSLANSILELVNRSSYEDFVSSFETNVFGPIKVTRAVLPHMRARKSGTMVFISSLSGWVGHQFTGAYAGSKFALEGQLSNYFNL